MGPSLRALRTGLRALFESAARPEWILVCIAGLAVALCNGCASFEQPVRWTAPGGYWVKTSPAIDNPIIIEVEDPTYLCTGAAAQAGSIYLACFSRPAGAVFLRKGLAPAVKACVISHEATGLYSHAAGFDHPGADERPDVDCADGTTLSIAGGS